MSIFQNRFAYIGVRPVENLAATARLLGEALLVSFIKDEQHLYDEYPAYIAEEGGIRYALLGTPAPEDDLREEPTDDFQLMIEPLSSSASIASIEVDNLLRRVAAKGEIICWPLT